MFTSYGCNKCFIILNILWLKLYNVLLCRRQLNNFLYSNIQLRNRTKKMDFQHRGRKHSIFIRFCMCFLEVSWVSSLPLCRLVLLDFWNFSVSVVLFLFLIPFLNNLTSRLWNCVNTMTYAPLNKHIFHCLHTYPMKSLRSRLSFRDRLRYIWPWWETQMALLSS